MHHSNSNLVKGMAVGAVVGAGAYEEKYAEGSQGCGILCQQYVSYDVSCMDRTYLHWQMRPDNSFLKCPCIHT